MNERVRFSRHTAALCGVFVLGNGIITLPRSGADEFTFSAFLAVGVCLLISFYIICVIADGLNKINFTRNLLLRTVSSIFLLALAVFSLFCAADTFLQVTDFFSKVLLAQTSRFSVCLVFGAAVLYFALKRQENLLKFCLVGIVLVTAVIVFFFIAASDNYNLRNIFVFRLPSMEEFKNQVKPYLVNPLIHSLILPFFLLFTFKDTCKSAGNLGVALGLVLLSLGLLSSVLLFGADIAGELNFPFNSAVSTVTVGRLFTRLDGFAYFVYFICSLVKITVCADLSRDCILKISQMIDKKEE